MKSDIEIARSAKLEDIYYIAKKAGIKEDEVINGAVKGLLESLGDPHTSYLSDKVMKEMSTTTQGEYGGVGMLISEREEKIVVISPFEGTPSFKKGIKAGDYIISVDGFKLEGVSVSEAANKLRGKPGTTVKIEILRNDQIFKFNLVRAKINLPTVKNAMIKDKYGYLRI